MVDLVQFVFDNWFSLGSVGVGLVGAYGLNLKQKVKWTAEIDALKLALGNVKTDLDKEVVRLEKNDDKIFAAINEIKMLLITGNHNLPKG